MAPSGDTRTHLLGTAAHLRKSASRWPERIALVFEGSRWSYRELDTLVDEAAARYQRQGVTAGRRAVLLMANRPEYFVAHLALARLGAAVVTPNPYWTDAELTPAIAGVKPDWAVVEDRFAGVIDGTRRLPIPALDATTGARPVEPLPDGNREAYLPFSSGTTGLPKAVVHTTASLASGIEQLVHHLALTEADRLQMALPLCHIFGTVMSGAGFSVGATITLFERFDLNSCLDHVEKDGVTILSIAGTTAYQLAERTDLASRTLSSLRFFMWGGSLVPNALAIDITRRTGIGFLCSYGMTEAISVACNPVGTPEEWSLESPGLATQGVELRLSSEDGEAGHGELEIRTPSLARGYVGVTDDAWLPDGWFRTGDLARIGPDGRLFIVDRKKDMLKVSGFQVSPVEVEQALISHPQVQDCGVIGIDDERSGQAPVAVVVPHARGVSEADLAEWAKGRLAKYKLPVRYIMAAAIPRNAGGKLNRATLLEQFGSQSRIHTPSTN